MNIDKDIADALGTMGLPIAVGMYKTKGPYPDAYIVIAPLDERNDDIADDMPLTETAAADVNLHTRKDYRAAKDGMKALLEAAGFYLEDRRYVAYDSDTGHHHYVITVERMEIL